MASVPSAETIDRSRWISSADSACVDPSASAGLSWPMKSCVVIESGVSSAGFRRPGRGGWFGTGGMLMGAIFSQTRTPPGSRP
ncbi:Uncharacterised protein [Mycobacteroides abscessus subsp. abscessus]|nr:Uncharacterised protein [Mycobacteroides abscessus subsp. abscessus]